MTDSLKRSLSCAALALIAACACAQDFALQPAAPGNFRFKDYLEQVFSAAYIQNYSYSNAQVNVSMDTAGAAYLYGSIQATGLKPNFAYQIKLGGRPSKLYTGGDADDATNERLGFIGRWWRQYPNPANSNDADYNANKDNPNYAYQGYLNIAFFLTDENGNASIHFDGNNSYHVLWRTSQRSPTSNDGPIFNTVRPDTTGNPAYDVSSPSTAVGIYGEWEPTRALPGTLAMPQAHYACQFVLTEESFHDVGTNAGNWTEAMVAPVEFDIGDGGKYNLHWSDPASITYPTPLSAVQLNATAGVPGYFTYAPTFGTVLGAGPHSLSVVFTPYDPGPDSLPVTVTLNVAKGTPTLTWYPPQSVRAGKALDATIFNAESDVPGQFAYDPPMGTVLSDGTHTLTAQFLPDDQANYSIPPQLSFQVVAVTGLLTTSGPWVTPNPAYAGFPVQFSAASEARGLMWNWDFGDGIFTINQNVCSHTFTNPGTYSGTLTVQVKGGRAESQPLTVLVLPVNAAQSGPNGGNDDDGDGFDNALELAWGSDPSSAAATPLDGANGLLAESVQLGGIAAQIKQGKTPARCNCADTYSIRLRATIAVNLDFQPAGKRLGVSVAGVARAVGLDARGVAKVDGAAVSVKSRLAAGSPRTATIDVTMSGKYGDLSSAFMSPYQDGTARSGWVTIVLDGRVYRSGVTFGIKSSGRAAMLNGL
ncbi:MAG TPA: PKD domain-containing protein [Planctomycetota bacterium]|nr:PKD domain-containing protein [Planctomycetota bacterium]